MSVDALSGEARGCSRCGWTPGLSGDKPLPAPEHQRRITKSKFFEISAVALMIVVGLTFVSVRNRAPDDDVLASVVSLSNVAGANNYEFTGESSAFGRKFLGYQKEAGIFQTTLQLIANEESDALEAILIVVASPVGKAFPPDQVAESAIQASLDDITVLSGELHPTFVQAMETASKTMTAGKDGVAHTKGVSQTSDGWKLTYIVYRGYEESGSDIPLLLLLFQRLSAASDPELAEFNGIVFDAISRGIDPLSSLQGA